MPHDSERRNLANDALTGAVLASFAGARDDRFKAIAESLVRHLHDFVTDVRLTEEEWFKAVDFLTRTGQLSSDKRQEFETLITHMFVEGDEHLDRDAVFGVKSSLIAPFERHEPGTAPDGKAVATRYYTMSYDLVLAPARALP